MIKDKKRFRFWLLCTVVFMGIIFWQSNKPYEEQDVKPLLSEYIKVDSEQLPALSFYYGGHLVTYEDPYSFLEFFIRKTGHVVEFGLLSFLWTMTLFQTSLSKKYAIATGSLLSLLYALSDEWHQSLVPNRTGHLIDVFTFDLLGVLLSALILLLYLRWRERSGNDQNGPVI